MSRTSLATASGLPRHRLAQLEDPSSDALPSAQELYALFAALEVTLEDFTTAALKPLSVARTRRQSARPARPAADPRATSGSALLPAADAAERSIARFAARWASQPSSSSDCPYLRFLPRIGVGPRGGTTPVLRNNLYGLDLMVPANPKL